MPRITTFIFTLLVLAGAIAHSQPAATNPSTQPVVNVELPSDSPIRGWFADLANPDAAVRDKAQSLLMGISRNELWGLRHLIEQTRPLAPSQVTALHDIVIQAYLSGDEYEPMTPAQSFLGVRWPNQNFGLFPPPPAETGVSIEERLPGFPAYQALRDGDVIQAVVIAPGTEMEQLRPLQSPENLRGAVSTSPPDKPIILIVLRQGQQIRVTLRLAALPKALSQGDTAVMAFLAPRVQRAEQFWQEQFLPLLRPGVS
jgi:hypothetical protein